MQSLVRAIGEVSDQHTQMHDPLCVQLKIWRGGKFAGYKISYLGKHHSIIEYSYLIRLEDDVISRRMYSKVEVQRLAYKPRFGVFMIISIAHGN